MTRVISRGNRLLIPCLLAAAGCGRLLDTRNPSRRSDAMVLLDGAREVTCYRDHEANGREELEGISYLLDAEFPAERVICQVTARARAFRVAATAADTHRAARSPRDRPRT
jgi:hypothetical protein